MRQEHTRSTEICDHCGRLPSSDKLWVSVRASRFVYTLIMYFVLLAHGQVAAERGPSFADERQVSKQGEVTLKNMMAHVERLQIKMGELTKQMEKLVALSDQEPLQPDQDQRLKSAENPGGTEEEFSGKSDHTQFEVDEGGDGPGSREAERFGDDSEQSAEWSAWFAMGIFVHEVWVLLQHANILLNPLCQRLDRNYGVALLKKRMYWVIALVLAAYWARELLSMWMAATYFSPLTFRLVVVSTVYHVGKITLIAVDANRGWSPTLGIMHLLMDHWHLSSAIDLLLCIKRFVLQAFDTATHALIVRDMLRWDENEYAEGAEGLQLYRTLIVVGIFWGMHAIANLVTRKSTATLVVELAKAAVGVRGKWVSGGEEDGVYSSFGALDNGSVEFACTSSCSHGHKRCEVCHLLTRDQPSSASRRKRVD